FRESDLHLSTFNWADFDQCDFTACDLREADLSACIFRRCSFAGADLSGADLRGSQFQDCDFSDANLTLVRLIRRRRLLGLLRDQSDQGGLPLSRAQRSSAAWTSEWSPPPGG